MKLLNTIVLTVCAVALAACGSNDKKTEPPAYYYAKEGKPLAAIAPKGINMPDLSGALVIPKVNQPLGEYNPDLIDPPSVISAADEVTGEKTEAEDEE